MIWWEIVLIVFSSIVGLVFTLLLIAYLFLPYYFVQYAKRYDGSYDPKEDPLVDGNWEKNYSLKLENDIDIDVRFNEEEKSWIVSIQDKPVLEEIGAWFVLNGVKYSTNPVYWGGKKLMLVDSNIMKKTRKGDVKYNKILQTIWKVPNSSIGIELDALICSDKDCIVFKIRPSQKMTEIGTSEIDPINLTFPAFSNSSSMKRTLSYKDTVFCPPQKDFKLTHGPVCAFDDQKNVMVFSALQHFLVSPWRKSFKGEIDQKVVQKYEFGIHSSIDSVPSDFMHESCVVFGSGIRKTFQKWADFLREYHQLPEKPLKPDVCTTYLGYYTDNGAAYYYNTEKGMKADETLLAVKQKADSLGIPYRFYHLDSWWYQKTTSQKKQKWLGWLGGILGGALYGGALLWEPDSNYWKWDPARLSEKLVAPFSAHNRWFEPGSPYKKKFNFIEEKGWIIPDDDAFWDHIMKYCKDNNIAVYEQDWMSNQIKRFSHFRNTLGGAEKWLEQMAMNAEKYGRTVQYCMETPAMVLQSMFYPAVTHCRMSDDYHGYTFKTYDIPGFTQASLLAHVLGLRPFKDVFKTTKFPLFKYRGERIPELECLLASLSTGPVAPGDQLDHMNKKLIMRSCRKDGLLLQPTFPLTAIDLMYVKNETYYICSAKTEYKAEGTLLNWFFVLTINLFPKRVSQKTYRAREFGILGKKYVEFDWHSREIRIVSGESLVAQDLGFEEYKYRVYSPILPNGASIIGNPEKFATFNLQQFKDLLSTNTITKLTLELVKDEETPIFVCLPSDEEFEIDVNGKKLAPNKEISGEGLTVNWTILSKFTNFGVEINKLSLISKTNLKISVEIENKIKKI